MNKPTPLERAIKILGNDSRMAKKLGITPWAVSKWNPHKPPKDRCLAIQKATDNQVTAEELRPDINWDYVRKKESTNV